MHLPLDLMELIRARLDVRDRAALRVAQGDRRPCGRDERTLGVLHAALRRRRMARLSDAQRRFLSRQVRPDDPTLAAFRAAFPERLGCDGVERRSLSDLLAEGGDLAGCGLDDVDAVAAAFKDYECMRALSLASPAAFDAALRHAPFRDFVAHPSHGRSFVFGLFQHANDALASHLIGRPETYGGLGLAADRMAAYMLDTMRQWWLPPLDTLRMMRRHFQVPADLLGALAGRYLDALDTDSWASLDAELRPGASASASA